MTPSRTVAGVVTFDPEIELLLENVRAIAAQVDRVLVFDNGSSNIRVVEESLTDVANVELIASHDNVGIAAAFNRIAHAAEGHGAEWLVTLDQDSVCADGMVQTLHTFTDGQTPIVTPYIVDRKKIDVTTFRSLALPDVEYFRTAASKGAITSGALVNLRVLQKVGGFDESFFIDYVDYDLNMRVMLAGYRIARCNSTYILHQVGDAEATWLRTPRRSMDGRWRWERFYSFGHSPFRCYYKARNRVLYSKKYWRQIGFANEGVAQIPQQILLTLAFERDRAKKLRAFLRGIRDGVQTPIEQKRGQGR